VTASAGQLAGLVIACGAAAIAIVARSPRVRALAMCVALAAAAAVLAGDVWEEHRFAQLRDEPAKLAALAAGAALAMGLLAWVFRRNPAIFPVLALAVLPLRIPVSVGHTANLLVPLYLVIASGAAGAAYGALFPPHREPPDARSDGPPAGRLTLWLLAATLLLYAIQAAYSKDVSNAIENASFFLVPFAVLLSLLLDVPWSTRLAGLVLKAVVAVAVVFAGVAFWEYAVRDLILNHALDASNQIHRYFRVNSLFRDPNVFGRYLALVIAALAAYATWTGSRRDAIGAAVAAAVLMGALALTFSVSSFAALTAGLLLLAALRWGLLRAAAAGAGLLALAAAFLLVTGTGGSEFGSARDLNRTSSGRVDLVKGGLELAEDRPGWGWGSGSFGAAFQRRIERARTVNSHSEPITVAAEQGAIGVAVYLALLAASLVALLAGARASPARAAVAACFVAMIVHSLGYASFTTDPATWALIAIGIALARAPAPAAATPAPAPAGANAREPAAAT
jgi:O-antigen ligase